MLISTWAFLLKIRGTRNLHPDLIGPLRMLCICPKVCHLDFSAGLRYLHLVVNILILNYYTGDIVSAPDPVNLGWGTQIWVRGQAGSSTCGLP